MVVNNINEYGRNYLGNIYDQCFKDNQLDDNVLYNHISELKNEQYDVYYLLVSIMSIDLYRMCYYFKDKGFEDYLTLLEILDNCDDVDDVINLANENMDFLSNLICATLEYLTLSSTNRNILFAKTEYHNLDRKLFKLCPTYILEKINYKKDCQSYDFDKLLDFYIQNQTVNNLNALVDTIRAYYLKDINSYRDIILKLVYCNYHNLEYVEGFTLEDEEELLDDCYYHESKLKLLIEDYSEKKKIKRS
ncbi:MAG: hypothetical protein V8Q75_03685 [Bacilli bacterium]